MNASEQPAAVDELDELTRKFIAERQVEINNLLAARRLITTLRAEALARSELANVDALWSADTAIGFYLHTARESLAGHQKSLLQVPA